MGAERNDDDTIAAENVSLDEMFAEFINFDAELCFDEPYATPSKAPPEADSSRSPSANPLHTTQSAIKPQCSSTVSKQRQDAVFIRIEKISLVVDDVAEKFRCNKRSLRWHDEDGNNVQVGWLIENPGPLVQVDIRPNGFGFPVTVSWNAEDKCFKGKSMEDQLLIIHREESRDMVVDPWGRQYVGYYKCVGKD